MDAQKYGYRRLADFMAWESSLAIFPRFRSATMLCLLQMQAEITEIEEDLEKFAHEDGKSSDDKKKEWLRDWSSLDTTSKDSRQCKLLRLRSLLAEYNQTLEHQLTLWSQPGPRPKDLSYLQYWMDHPSGGASQLRGPGSMTWDPPNEGGREAEDLISLEPTAFRERAVTQWVLDMLWPLFKHLPGPLMPIRVYHLEDGQNEFAKSGSTARWTSIADQISCFVATVLILVPVITLHFVHSANTRLIVIVVFSVAFQGMVVLMTQATRSEVFAATAAFVAIQVIYVGSALGPAST